MTLRLRSACLIVVAGLAIGLTASSTSEAHDTANKSSIDCSKADTMIMQPSSSMDAMKPSGDVDKDFAQSMMMHNAAMMAMIKAEITCGKNPKVRSMAQKILDQVNLDDGLLRQLIGGAG